MYYFQYYCIINNTIVILIRTCLKLLQHVLCHVLFMIQCRMNEHNWNKTAGLLLKTEMKRKNMTSEKLAKRLKKIGVDTTADSIRQKISRGTLKTSLLLQCLYIMKTDSLDIGYLFPKEEE